MASVQKYTSIKGKTTINALSVYTQSLQLYLDTGNSASYSGSGSTWNDLSGFGRNATLFNTPTYSSNFGGYLAFDDASAEYATAPNLGNLSNWTVEAWFRLTSSLSGKVTAIISNEFDLINKLNFSIGTNNAPTNYNLTAGFFDGQWRNVTGVTPSINTWYQIAGTYDGSTLRQYLNGVANGGTLNYAGNPQSGGVVRIMRRWDTDTSAGNLVKGDLAIVRIYSTALSSNIILNNFNVNRARFSI